MSQSTVNSDVSTKDPLIAKIHTFINEERVMKDFSAIQLNRVKQIDELIEEIKTSGKLDQAKQVLQENLTEESTSLLSRYVLGILDPANTGATFMRTLLEDFRKAAKWTIVDHIADQILLNDENNRQALRAKVDSTERLKGKKELRPFLEKLATIDRKNPEIAHKYAMSILEEDRERALQFLKQAAETYARMKDYKHLDDIWNLLVVQDHKDISFFEKIERILIGHREKIRMAANLQTLVEPYKLEEDWQGAINILKKILEYEPASSRARSDLVRCYKALYADHSLLNDFLKMSDLTNNKKSVGPCIASFERNIVFDKDNYVSHRTRGVGKITSIDKDQVVIDFPENSNQQMSIQMAISSLQPLGKNHIWVKLYENPDEVKEVFGQDLPLFFEMLLSSFGNKMTLSEIKTEVSGKFITADEWSKWWSKARTQLKKSDKFGFNPKKKDELILRDRPITLSEDLTAKFQSTGDWNKKLEYAFESLKDMDFEDAIHQFAVYYRDQEENKDSLKKLQSYLFVELATMFTGDDDITHKIPRDEIKSLFLMSKPSSIAKYSGETSILELKREIVNFTVKYRTDYPVILEEILFEVPVKVNKYVMTELNRLEQYETLEHFIKLAFARYREHPEVFLWISKSIMTGQWQYDWLHHGKEEVVLHLFRLLKPLVQIEKKGTRLKNTALETIFGTTNITVENIKNGSLPEIILSTDAKSIRRMLALFKEVPYVPDAHKENFIQLIHELRSEYATIALEEGDEDTAEEEIPEESLFPPENVVLVSESGLAKRKEHLDNLINVEMPANSRDIGEAQEKGDLRENAEYKAAMERQQQLQSEILKLTAELKKASIIEPSNVRTDIVTIGSKVSLATPEGENIVYSILGPWDADTDNNIISYRSPLGMALIGKTTGEEAILDKTKHFRINKIEKAI